MFWRKKRKTDPFANGRPEFTSGALTVKSVFAITGRGTVATGIVDYGRLVTGQPVTVTRYGQMVVAATIDGVEQFRATTDVAETGAEVGLLLRGVERSQVQPGDVITG
ncbi:EF-Tu/IF-2/RF-3 family GTPase [Ruania alba]|uniref:EF-Tu/IF-2/RF-3 family GTPase n=1 Tax=Ruania alba TaxID=648782 RepID=UPI000B8007AF|nr:EF-Tu/IF-2/RF-3 family GTPase [Ruania alba]